MSSPIAHKTNLRAFILDAAKQAHPSWDVTQVTAEVLAIFEYKFKNLVRASVKRHPPQGKTVRDVY